MTETLTLPTGEEVTPDDAFLYDDYPYRFAPMDDDRYAFALSPLYWGDSGMDVPFRSREAFLDQWVDERSGTMTDDDWRGWLRDARGDDRFDDAELDSLARELGVDDEAARGDRGGDDDSAGLVARLRGLLGT
ncbi:hypothetical protein [Halobaculum sp. D14]|uniref:hypothetical protein n=1 Tax=unclassified Halobaculum TaxID=2640896 RepID=UPI003EC13EC2